MEWLVMGKTQICFTIFFCLIPEYRTAKKSKMLSLFPKLGLFEKRNQVKKNIERKEQINDTLFS